MACSRNVAAFTEKDIPDLEGYVALVTGGNSGIGYETSYQLASKGAKVYIGGRSEERVQQAVTKMCQTAGRQLDIHFLQMNLENLKSLKAAVDEFSTREACLDLLINNAGIMNTPYELTVDGFERQWQVNYVAPHVLDHLFLQHLLTAADIHQSRDRVRVIHVSSDLARFGPDTPQLKDPNLSTSKGASAPRTRYSHSKQATIRDAWEFNRHYAGKGVTAYAVHPGVIKTNLQGSDPSVLGTLIRAGVNFGGGTPLEGCRNTLYCATSAQAVAIGAGKFFLPVGKLDASKEKWFLDETVNRALWDHGERQLTRIGVQ